MSISKYFKGVIYEAKKVEWPRGEKLRKMVISVVQFCIIFGAIFYVMDLVINWLLGMMGI